MNCSSVFVVPAIAIDLASGAPYVATTVAAVVTLGPRGTGKRATGTAASRPPFLVPGPTQ